MTLSVCQELKTILYQGKSNRWDLKLGALSTDDQRIVNEMREKYIIGTDQTTTSLSVESGMIQWNSFKTDYLQAIMNIDNIIENINSITSERPVFFITGDRTIPANLTITPFNFYKRGEINNNMTFKKTMPGGIVRTR